MVGNKIKFNCEFCGNETTQFKAWYKRSTHHTCSRDCADALKTKLIKTCICVVCKKEYNVGKGKRTTKTCSKQCRKIYASDRVNIVCKCCGTTFSVNKARKDTAAFCSYDCMYKYKSAINSFETQCTNCGKSLLRKNGSKRTSSGTDIKLFFCNKNCKDAYLKGKNHPNYKPDARKRGDWKLYRWGYEVKKRDMCCIECGVKEKLQAHHILSRNTHPDKKYDLTNGVTLCLECHSTKHPELPKSLFLKQNASFTDVKRCLYCNEEFMPYNKSLKYCSTSCAKSYRKWQRNQKRTG